MFCEIHDCLVDYRGCPECLKDDWPKFISNNGCSECGNFNFLISEEKLYICDKCKTEHEIIPDQEGYLRKAYVTIYELFKRNKFQPYFWAKEKVTGELAFILEIYEMQTGIRKWTISDGIFMAKYNHLGNEIDVFRWGKGRKSYRPFVSGSWEKPGIDSSILPKNFGFMLGEELDEDWKIHSVEFKSPTINDNYKFVIDQCFARFRERNLEMATEKQKEFLKSKKIGYLGDVEKLTKLQAQKILTRSRNQKK